MPQDDGVLSVNIIDVLSGINHQGLGDDLFVGDLNGKASNNY